MANFVVLDTSIYRELGFKFDENLDYQNLKSFTIGTDSEILLSPIVAKEFIDFFTNQLSKKHNEYNGTIIALKRTPFFDTNKNFPEVSDDIDRTLDKFKKAIYSHPRLQDTYISSQELTDFILASRNQGITNIQVRDYLIWDSILTIALKESRDRVEKFYGRKIKHEAGIIYFITRDKIYSEDLFQLRRENLKIGNIEIFNSIPDFLYKKGYNISFLTEQLLLNKITDKKVIRDLSTDILCLPSYVDPKYNRIDKNICKVISIEIKKKEIREFYSYYDIDGVAMYAAHLNVRVKVVYEILSEMPVIYNDSRRAGGSDEVGRLYYVDTIIFIYRGLLDVDKEQIMSVKFIDFLP